VLDGHFDKQAESNGHSDRQIDAFSLLDQQIKNHRRHEKQTTWLGHGIAKITGTAADCDRSLARLVELKEKDQREQKAGEQKALAETKEEIIRHVKADRDKLGWKDEVGHYSSAALKTATLFLRGRVALAGTVALYGLDQANPNDTLKTQFVDLTLGGAKGGAMRLVLQTLGERPVSAASKGVAMGLANTACEIGLTRKTYLDRTGSFNLNSGLEQIVSNSLDLRARAIDGGVFLFAHGLSGAANKFSHGALQSSPLWNTVFTGGTFGLSSGATGEYMRQNATGESFDLTKVITCGLKQAAVDSIASVPGGIQARSIMHRQSTAAGVERNPQARLDQHDAATQALKLQSVLEQPNRFTTQTGAEHKLSGNVEAELNSNGGRAKSLFEPSRPSVEDSSQLGLPARVERSRTDTGSAENTAETVTAKPTVQKSIDWDAPGTMDIVPLPEGRMEILKGKIGDYKVVTEKFPVAIEGDTATYKCWSDFFNRGLKWEDRPLRLYEVKDSQVKISVREEHAHEIEKVRELEIQRERKPDAALTEQLSKLPMFENLRPEHIAQLLSELPDGGVIFAKRINLLYGEISPYDRWHRQSYDREFKTAGQASRDGEIDLFSTKRDSLERIRHLLFHEWAHLVKFALPKESNLFNLATVLEEHGWAQRRYARKDTEENWAVHFEKALRADGDHLLELEAAAPIRLAMFGRTLGQILEAVPEASRSPHHEQYQKRVKFITQEVMPEAIDRLWSLQDSPNARYRKIATQLLGHLGDRTDLVVLARTCKNGSSNARDLNQQFLAAKEIGSRHPDDWLDKLAFMSNGESKVKQRATDELANFLAANQLPAEIRYSLEPDARRMVALKAAEKLAQEGTFGRARELADAALQSAEKWGFVCYEDYRFIVDSINRIAGLHAHHGSARRGEQLVQRLLDVQLGGEHHADTAITLSTIAALQAKQGKTIYAVASYELALNITETRYGKDHPRTEKLRHELASVHSDQGSAAEAIPHFKYLLDDPVNATDKNFKHRLAVIQRAADRFSALREHEFSEALSRRAIEMLDGRVCEELADTHHWLGYRLWEQQRLLEAAESFKQELEVRDQLSNQDTQYIDHLKSAIRWVEQDLITTKLHLQPNQANPKYNPRMDSAAQRLQELPVDQDSINPMLYRYQRAVQLGRLADFKSDLTSYYAHAVPTEQALALMGRFGPIVEIGAGSGYWSALLRQRGVDVTAYDAWLGSTYAPGVTWSPVLTGDAKMSALHPDHSLFLCWPTGAGGAYEALSNYKGKRLLYVGEMDSDIMADQRFFTALKQDWRLTDRVAVPSLQPTGTFDHSLFAFERKE
jgi:tetratricopeptide (TPR) repeat protein